MAWHFVNAPVTKWGDPGVSPKILKDPPVTAFVAEGDRVIDLSDGLRLQVKGGDETWLIWNETRHELIARGKATTLALVERDLKFYDQPKTFFTTFDWYEGIGPGKPVPPEATPVATLITTSRSGNSVSGGWTSSQPGPLSHVKVETEITSAGFSASCRWVIDWAEQATTGKRFEWSFNSTDSFDAAASANQILTQCVSPSGGSWTITGKVEARLEDGTPTGRMLRTEVAGKPEVIERDFGSFEMIRHAKIQTARGSLWCASFFNTEGTLEFLAGSKTGKNETPFFAQLVDAEVPGELKALTGGSLIDCWKLVSSEVPDFKATDFAGYDPRSLRLWVAVEDERVLQAVESLMMGWFHSGPLSLHARLKVGAGATIEKSSPDVVLVCKSGQKGRVECKDHDGAVLLAADIEPIVDESESLVNLQYEVTHKTADGFETRAKGDANLIDERETVLQILKSGDRSVSLFAQVNVRKKPQSR